MMANKWSNFKRQWEIASMIRGGHSVIANMEIGYPFQLDSSTEDLTIYNCNGSPRNRIKLSVEAVKDNRSERHKQMSGHWEDTHDV